MTYKEAIKILRAHGLNILFNGDGFAILNDDGDRVSVVDVRRPYQMLTSKALNELPECNQQLIGDIMSQLMMTKIGQRYDEKLYFVKFLDDNNCSYLQRNSKTGNISIGQENIGNKYDLWLFTEDEINAINPTFMKFATQI